MGFVLEGDWGKTGEGGLEVVGKVMLGYYWGGMFGLCVAIWFIHIVNIGLIAPFGYGR